MLTFEELSEKLRRRFVSQDQQEKFQENVKHDVDIGANHWQSYVKTSGG